MKEIDLTTWPRKKHFEVFNSFDYPHFNLCANVDISSLYSLAKAKSKSLHTTLVYVISRTVNDYPEFRWRIRKDKVVEHDIVHPSASILTSDDLFSFCTMRFYQSFAEFYPNAEATIANTKQHPTLEDEPGQDDLLFLTSIPWVSFTGIMHPIHMHPVDSVPRFAWGKFYKEHDRIMLPLSVQVHHALMDGYHAGRYFQKLQEYLDAPESWLV
jgi:chloramphenicol O-acetyltransferase type A